MPLRVKEEKRYLSGEIKERRIYPDGSKNYHWILRFWNGPIGEDGVFYCHKPFEKVEDALKYAEVNAYKGRFELRIVYI